MIISEVWVKCDAVEAYWRRLGYFNSPKGSMDG